MSLNKTISKSNLNVGNKPQFSKIVGKQKKLMETIPKFNQNVQNNRLDVGNMFQFNSMDLNLKC